MYFCYAISGGLLIVMSVLKYAILIKFSCDYESNCTLSYISVWSDYNSPNMRNNKTDTHNEINKKKFHLFQTKVMFATKEHFTWVASYIEFGLKISHSTEIKKIVHIRRA